MKKTHSLILADNAYCYTHIDKTMEAISRFLLNTDIFVKGRDLLAEFLKTTHLEVDGRHLDSYAAAILWMVLESSGITNRDNGISNTVYCKVTGTTKATLQKRIDEITGKIQQVSAYRVKIISGWDLNLSGLATDDQALFGSIREDVIDRISFSGGYAKDYGKTMHHYDRYLDELERDILLDEALLSENSDDDDDFNLFSESEARGLLSELQSIGDDPYQSLYAVERTVEKLETLLFPEKRPEGADLWYDGETRDYMMLKYQLMIMQRNLGETEKAIETGKALMLLSPSDGLGVRYDLLPLAIYSKNTELAQKLIEETDEHTALWNYTKGLYYIVAGDRDTARKILMEAIKENHYIPMYLEEHGLIPEELPMEYTSGTPEEAYIYCAAALPAWHSVHGALKFLDQLTKMGKVVHLHQRKKK